MNWFKEGIGAAIAEAKTKGAIFAVVVKSAASVEQEETVQLEEALTDQEVIFKFSSMVCIEVEAGSTTCIQFSAIYPVMVVPSVYFIDSTSGVDLEITGGKVTAASLLASIQRAENRLAVQQEAPAPASAAAPAPAPAPAHATAPAPEAAAPATPTEAPAPAEAPSTSSAPAPAEASSTSLALAERVARAKQLMAERQEEKEREEEDKEKNQEMERRKLGQVLQEQKRTKEETELRKAAMERKKDKEEEKKAREAVKAAIEQDRQARKVKYDAEKQEQQEQRAEAQRVNMAAAAAAAEVSAAERASVARIQFRLPDGRNQTKQFPADTPLAELYSFVQTEMETGFSTFSLSTTFPRRQLDLEDKATSLRQLQMAPSATVLVIPKVSSTSLSLPGDGSLTSLLWLLLSPFTMLWAMLSSLLPNNQESAQPSRAPGNRSGGMGRIRRGDDDENNTYNGNSTQQM